MCRLKDADTSIIQQTSYRALWKFHMSLLCRLKDADSIGAPTMGLTRVPVAELVKGQVFEEWFPLVDTVMHSLKHGAALRATVSFRCCSRSLAVLQLIASKVQVVHAR